MAWAARLLVETGVAVAPGLDFDPLEGSKFIRMCFAGDATEIVTAVDLLGEWLAKQP
jgi:aspartate/methionine/tyrosine aminotransferase